MAERVLVVEDEIKLATLMRDYLAREGYEVSMLHRGDEVGKKPAADLVLLDLMLPGMNGLEVCKQIRASSEQVGIIMVTARVEEIDRLLGLELGADDYICKPFSPREVVARVKAVLRRKRRSGSPAPLETGLVLDDAAYRATLDGRVLDLTTVEYQLLKVLASQPGRIFSRQQLMDAMYRDERVVSDRTVDSHIKKIRRKIAGVVPERELIHSLYGAGYKFEP